MEHRNNNIMYGTTILSIRRGSNVVIAGDGQVSLGPTIMKRTAVKVKRFDKHPVISGFAGATSDAFTLFGRLESKLDQHPGLLMRACVELAKDWRSDRYLRKLEAMMIVADTKVSLVISGTGDILEPEDGIAAIGSGGNFALSAAKALVNNSQGCDLCKKMSLREIIEKAMKIAADICVYTNNELVIEEMGEE